MYFTAPFMVLVLILAATFESSSASIVRFDQSEPWFKPSPNIRSTQYHARSRFGGSRLLPRRMYRSAPSYYNEAETNVDGDF